MQKILLVIDFQNDFVAPSGVLAIKTAPKIAPFIQDKINDMSYERIIYTMDTHTEDAYPKSEESIPFPNIHCEYNTFGWQWFNIKPRNQFVFGEHPFDYARINEEEIFCKDKFSVWEGNKYFQKMINSFDKNVQIDVVGVAYDYCVFYAVEGLIKEGFKNINILMDGTDFISEESRNNATKAFKEMNICLKG